MVQNRTEDGDGPIPAARPITVFSYAPEFPRPLPEFPLIEMRRGAAAVDLGVIVLLMAAFLFLTILTFIVLARLGIVDPRSGPSAAEMFLPVAANGAFSLIAVFAMIRIRRQTPAAIGLKRRPLHVIAVGALVALPVCFLCGFIANMTFVALSQTSMETFVEERAEFLGEIGKIPLGWIVPVSVFVGIYEEILFRGFILSRLCALFRSRAAPIVISSAVFGALHFDQGLAGMIQTGVIGLVMAIVVTTTKSLWPAIIAHASIDAIGLLLSALLRDIMPTLVEQATTSPAG